MSVGLLTQASCHSICGAINNRRRADYFDVVLDDGCPISEVLFPVITYCGRHNKVSHCAMIGIIALLLCTANMCARKAAPIRKPQTI